MGDLLDLLFSGKTERRSERFYRVVLIAAMLALMLMVVAVVATRL